MKSTNKKPEEYGIKLKKYTQGTQKIKCPQCQPHDHNPKDNPLSITINDEGTVWFCHHCNWKGSYFNGSFKQINKKPEYVRPQSPKQSTT